MALVTKNNTIVSSIFCKVNTYHKYSFYRSLTVLINKTQTAFQKTNNILLNYKANFLMAGIAQPSQFHRVSLNFRAFLAASQQPILCSQFHKFLCEFFLKSHSFQDIRVNSIIFYRKNKVDELFRIAYAFHCR